MVVVYCEGGVGVQKTQIVQKLQTRHVTLCYVANRVETYKEGTTVVPLR